MEHLLYSVHVGSDEFVQVKLDKQANVFLVDNDNYEKYRNREDFQYYGGMAKKSPASLKPPSPGHWRLVVDLGGYEGEVKVSVNVVKE